MPGRLNNRNYNRRNGIRWDPNQPRGPTPPPIQDDDPPTQPHLKEGVNAEDDPEMYWYYGEGAGGMVLSYRKFYGKKINEVPLTYLNWCYNKLEYATTFRRAFEAYHHGLWQWVKDGNYGEIVVPMGHTYNNKRIRECRDKQWMKWLLRNAPVWLKEKHALFFFAIEQWVEHPKRQDAIRDIGELLHCTQYADDLDLRLEEEDEYDDDDCDEVDEYGNLRGFVVQDDSSRSEGCSERTSDDSDSESEASAKLTDEEDEEDNSTASEEGGEVGSVAAGNQGNSSRVSTPSTPRKRQRYQDSGDESSSGSEADGGCSPKSHYLSLRSGTVIASSFLGPGSLLTPPKSPKKRRRPESDSGEEEAWANVQLKTPASPRTPRGKFKRPRHNDVVLGDADDDDDDDDTPLDRVQSARRSRFLASPDATPSKPPKFSRVGLDGTPMKRLFRKS